MINYNIYTINLNNSPCIGIKLFVITLYIFSVANMILIYKNAILYYLLKNIYNKLYIDINLLMF